MGQWAWRVPGEEVPTVGLTGVFEVFVAHLRDG